MTEVLYMAIAAYVSVVILSIFIIVVIASLFIKPKTTKQPSNTTKNYDRLPNGKIQVITFVDGHIVNIEEKW